MTFDVSEHVIADRSEDSAADDGDAATRALKPAQHPVSEDDVTTFIQQGEGPTIEYKESLSDSFAREMVAFANTRGGKILLGVRDDGAIAGLTCSNNLRARIQDMARNCDPPVQITIEPVGRVIVVHVEASEVKPVQCREGFFSRMGAVSQKLSRNEVRDFFRSEGHVLFDTSLDPDFRYPEDFDVAKFEAWRRLADISPDASVEEVLINVRAAERKDGKLLVRNGGILFFAKEPQCFFEAAYITCIRFKSTTRVDVADRKDVGDGIVSDLQSALEFIERNTRTEYRIEGLQREDIPEYPMKALREAIANAVMHRDWYLSGANVFVQIYPDRIEVVSPGGLPRGLTADRLGQASVRRNPLIANLLHRIRYIEKAGTGIIRMREAARVHGTPEPEFETDTSFTARFRPLPLQHAGDQQAGRLGGLKYPPSTPQVPPEVLAALRAAEGGLTRGQLQDLVGVRDRKHFREAYLHPWLEAGLIEMTQPDKPNSSRQRYRAVRSR